MIANTLYIQYEVYRLPSGKNTKSSTIYVREWRKLANAVLKLLPGWVSYGFDPGLKLVLYTKNRFGDEQMTDQINLSVQAAKTLISSQKKK